MLCRSRLSVAIALAIALLAAAAHASNCDSTSKGFVPLTDLGAGLYHGFQGGLYLAGSNAPPPAHLAAGVAIANSIVPIDTSGNPAPTGKIVFCSIGMSNCTQEYSTFVPKSNADPARNPYTRVIDCAVGGQSADRINVATAPYWDSVATRLRGHGSTPLQVQVVWIKEANAGPTGGFPASAQVLTDNLGAVVRLIHAKLPNVRIAYLTSRIYAGYASTTLNPEPYAYESGFAVRWLIEAQIGGADSLNYDPNLGTVEAPWLAWGPYLWADGTTPRSDGLTWECSDFAADGTHPATSARNKVADSLLAFVHRDPTATPWYLRSGVGSAPSPGPESGIAMTIAPNPATQSVEIAFAAPRGERWRLQILDVAGRVVREIAAGEGDGGRKASRWDGVGRDGARVVPGLYWARVTRGARSEGRRFVWMSP